METQEQILTAKALNYNPNDSSHWPWSIIDQLIIIKNEYGEDEYWKEIHKLMSSR